LCSSLYLPWHFYIFLLMIFLAFHYTIAHHKMLYGSTLCMCVYLSQIQHKMWIMFITKQCSSFYNQTFECKSGHRMNIVSFFVSFFMLVHVPLFWNASHVVFMFCKSTSNCGTKFIRGCLEKKHTHTHTQSFTCNFQILLSHTYMQHLEKQHDDATWRHWTNVDWLLLYFNNRSK
jgi:hypothetical protein